MTLNKNTNSLPKGQKNDHKVLWRIERFENHAQVLKKFWESGFTNSVAFRTIVMHYFPDITKEECALYWNFRSTPDDVVMKIEKTLEILLSE